MGQTGLPQQGHELLFERPRCDNAAPGCECRLLQVSISEGLTLMTAYPVCHSQLKPCSPIQRAELAFSSRCSNHGQCPHASIPHRPRQQTVDVPLLPGALSVFPGTPRFDCQSLRPAETPG